MARKVKVGDRVAVQFGMVAETGVVTSVEDGEYVEVFIEDAGGFGGDVTVTREVGEIRVLA